MSDERRTFDDSLDMSDTSNGHHLVTHFGDRFARVTDQGIVRIWRDTHWEEDFSGDYMRELMEQLTDMLRVRAQMLIDAAARRIHEAHEPEDKTAAQEDMRAARKRAQWVTASRQGGHVREGIKLAVARPEVRTKSGQWDTAPELLNVANGTLELSPDGRHVLREHRQADRLTQLASVTYDAEAVHPRLDEFLERVLPDREVRRYVRALAGVALLGRNHGQRVVLLIGKTRSGKSTLVNLLQKLLGNRDDGALGYSASFSFKDLRPQNNGGPNPEMVKLLPKRFITATEAKDGAPLNADALKRFVGGDSIAVRDTYAGARSIVDRKPAFVPWLAINQVPDFDRSDEALIERLSPVPMDEYIEREDRIEDFEEVILKDEGAGTLNWALAGYLDAMANPTVLTSPPEACQATLAHMKSDMSIYARWISESTEPCDCQADPTRDKCKNCVPVADEWLAFKNSAWEQNEDLKGISRTRFSQEMAEAGYPGINVKVEGGKTVRVRAGLRLRAGVKGKADDRAEATVQRGAGVGAGMGLRVVGND
jgi:putative DNA primase/helicase